MTDQERKWQKKVDEIEEHLNKAVPKDSPPVEWVLPTDPHRDRLEALFEYGIGAIHVDKDLNYTFFGRLPDALKHAMIELDDNGFLSLR